MLLHSLDLTILLLRCHMWTVLRKRKPSTLWMTMPPRVEETKTHILSFFSFNVINHIWSKLCKKGKIVSTKRYHWKSCHSQKVSKRSNHNHCFVDIPDVVSFSLYLCNKNHIYDWSLFTSINHFQVFKLYFIIS